MRRVFSVVCLGVLVATLAGCTGGNALPEGSAPTQAAHGPPIKPDDCPGDTGGGLTGDHPCGIVTKGV